MIQTALHKNPLPREIALLGIAQRTLTVKYGNMQTKDREHKPLIENVKTIGEWIKFMRESRNMTKGQLGHKMGIAQPLVRAWEDGKKHPSDQQLIALERIFGSSSHF